MRYRKSSMPASSSRSQAAMLAFGLRDQLAHRVRILVVNHAGGARSARGADQLAGFLDGLAPAEFRRPGGPAATAGRVDEEPGRAQLDGDRPAGARGGAGHDSDGPAVSLISHQIS
jgi:hypothetical protein